MATVRIVDDCFAPRKFKIISYSGPDPFKIYREAHKPLKKIFEISTSKTGEPRFMWDWTGDPIQLFSHRVAKKPFSRFTTMWFAYRIVGFKYKTKNEGNFRMEVEASLEHTYGKGNWFLKLLWMIYWYLYYQKVRQHHLKLCQEYAERFITYTKNLYNIESTGPD
ncbi:MAG: hypothetical protein GXO64_01810 [Candidatus Micrarchaeota archaeon]|nr:hypothetical protein [Candidatus Micrarchaeota archaeon]